MPNVENWTYGIFYDQVNYYRKTQEKRSFDAPMFLLALEIGGTEAGLENQLDSRGMELWTFFSEPSM